MTFQTMEMARISRTCSKSWGRELVIKADGFRKAYYESGRYEDERRVIKGTVSLSWNNPDGDEDKIEYFFGEGLELPNDTASMETVDVFYKGGQNNVGWIDGNFKNGSTMGDTQPLPGDVYSLHTNLG